MSDIQTVLTRWGVWARDNSHLDYPHIASGFKGLVTSNRQVESCCDNNGLAIETNREFTASLARKRTGTYPSTLCVWAI